jgi:hypothetical protein
LTGISGTKLNVQAAITATMVGAVIGGATGALARLLSQGASSVNSGTGIFMPAQVVSIILAVILSAVAVVSFARKSGAQQIVSVEDFWGGLFLGFLIGFFGQEFALNLISPGGSMTGSSVR